MRQGRARFQLYQKLLALAAAVIQAVGQLTYIRPFVPEWDATWLVVNSLTLVAGAMVLVHVRACLVTSFVLGLQRFPFFTDCASAERLVILGNTNSAAGGCHVFACLFIQGCHRCTAARQGLRCCMPVLCQVADMITELKLGNGTSILITANIASALPASVGAAVQQAADKDSSSLPIYGLAFFLTTLGIVYVQEVSRSSS